MALTKRRRVHLCQKKDKEEKSYGLCKPGGGLHNQLCPWMNIVRFQQRVLLVDEYSMVMDEECSSLTNEGGQMQIKRAGYGLPLTQLQS
jgi:hypothetical protein